MTALTAELSREVEKAGDEPVRVEDPVNHERYVILKAALYEKLREQAEMERVDPSFYEYGEFIYSVCGPYRPTG